MRRNGWSRSRSSPSWAPGSGSPQRIWRYAGRGTCWGKSSPAISRRLSSVDVKDNQATIVFDPNTKLPEAGIRKLMDRYQRRLRLLSPMSFELQLGGAEWSRVAPELTAALQTLLVCDTKKSA